MRGIEQVIKEANRVALAKSRPAQKSSAPPILTLEQIAAIEGNHIVTIRNQARLGKIRGAEKRGEEWRANRVKYEKDLGHPLGTMPMP